MMRVLMEMKHEMVMMLDNAKKIRSSMMRRCTLRRCVWALANAARNEYGLKEIALK